jgi:hypothetical protein
MYCLEHSKDVLRASNLGALTRITGDVRVIYNNGSERITGLDELLKSGVVRLVPLNSYESMRFVFLDENIVEIRIGEDGIDLFRGEMTPNEEKLARVNIEKIKELEAQGKSHAEVQETIWRTKTGDWIMREDKHYVYDFMTTAEEKEKVHSGFDSTATVSYGRDKNMFLRLDGLLRGNENVNKQIVELITHFHSDHISRAEVERAIDERSFERLIAPNPALDRSRNKVFSAIEDQVGISEYNLKQENRVIEITREGIPLSNADTGVIGDFDYSKIRLDGNITVEMFKYRYPRDANNDGLIYRVTHNKVSYLLLGDFDNVNGIENLVNASAVNESNYYQKLEERSGLRIQAQEARDALTQFFVRRSEAIIPENSEEVIAQIAEQRRIIAELTAEIERLSRELARLPFIKADVIKYPHHAHIFENNERTDNIIKKLHEVIEPQFIIWQRHHTQEKTKFMEYIKRFGFHDKFLCSDEIDFEFVSRLDEPNTEGVS